MLGMPPRLLRRGGLLVLGLLKELYYCKVAVYKNLRFRQCGFEYVFHIDYEYSDFMADHIHSDTDIT